MNRVARSPRKKERRRWPMPSLLLAGIAVVLALGGTAAAATGLIRASDIAPGAVTGQAIRNGGVEPRDLSAQTRALLQAGRDGPTGATGAPGSGGTNGANGPNGANGVDGRNGTDGADGSDGIDGTNGSDGIDGTNGAPGADGTDGTDGVDGVDGTITPLSATGGPTALPTAAPMTTVVSLAVPAGDYVVLAKTQLSHTGAGDTVDCVLKAGTTTLDQIAMKTLPALAAIPASMQAVTTVSSPTQLAVECKVQVANGAANFSSLIAIPTG